MDTILRDLNLILHDLLVGWANNLTVMDNLAQCWLEVKVTEGVAIPPIPLPLLKGKQPFGVTVEYVKVVSGNLVEPVWVQWEPTTLRGQPALKLNSVFGLNIGTVINLRLLVKAE